jgi:hypothetical protein
MPVCSTPGADLGQGQNRRPIRATRETATGRLAAGERPFHGSFLLIAGDISDVVPSRRAVRWTGSAHPQGRTRAYGVSPGPVVPGGRPPKCVVVHGSEGSEREPGTARRTVIAAQFSSAIFSNRLRCRRRIGPA